MSEKPAESPSSASETARIDAPETDAPKIDAFQTEAFGSDADQPETRPRYRIPLRQRLHIALRSFVLAAACALTAFWIYTFYAIAQHADPKGDGMEWMAAFPMTLIFLLLTLPTLIVGLFGRALIFGVLVAIAAILVNMWVWQEIVAEFAS